MGVTIDQKNKEKKNQSPSRVPWDMIPCLLVDLQRPPMKWSIWTREVTQRPDENLVQLEGSSSLD